MFPDGDRNSPPAAVCMGTSVALGATVGPAVVGVVVTAGAEVATGLVAAGWAVAVRALAGGVAAADEAPAADDVPGPQADSASPAPRPSAEMRAILVVRMKCRKFIIVPSGSPNIAGRLMRHGPSYSLPCDTT
jgi:hypothetical protein